MVICAGCRGRSATGPSIATFRGRGRTSVRRAEGGRASQNNRERKGRARRRRAEQLARGARERGGAGGALGAARGTRVDVRARARRGGRQISRNTHSGRSD